MSMFQEAKRHARKLRCAIYGLSGGGKTFTSLAIASGMGNKIALIDTERHSSELYSDKFKFDVANVEIPTVENMVQVIKEAANAKYEVLIIDSLSHSWDELLAEVEKIANAQFRGNTWSAWQKGTPKQKQLIGSILDFPGHIIVTMRADTEWATERDQNGKNKPVKLGLKPNQRKGIEYEFDLVLNINQDHIATVEKARYEPFQDMIIEKPGKEFGKKLNEFLNGLEPEEKKKKAKETPPAQEIVPEAVKTIEEEIKECASSDELNKFWEKINPHGEYKNNSEVIGLFKTRKKELS